MAEIITIATRRISGTGLIIPSSADLNYRRYTLFADIIRKPRTPYINTNSSPPKTFYAIISLMKNDYVTQTLKVEFDAQIWTFDADITGQVINTIKCEYVGVLQSFANLGTALGLTVTSVENAIADFKNLPLQWDSIRVKCFGDSAIQFVLKGLEYDVCSPADAIPRAAPTAPTKPAVIAPGTPTNISSAYSGDSITNPAPIDLTFIPPPIGNVCQAYTLSFSVTTTTAGAAPVTVQRSTAVYAPVLEVFRVKAGQPNVLETQHRGNPLVGGCATYQYRDIATFGAGTTILSWGNIVLS